METVNKLLEETLARQRQQERVFRSFAENGVAGLGYCDPDDDYNTWTLEVEVEGKHSFDQTTGGRIARQGKVEVLRHASGVKRAIPVWRVMDRKKTISVYDANRLNLIHQEETRALRRSARYQRMKPILRRRAA